MVIHTSRNKISHERKNVIKINAEVVKYVVDKLEVISGPTLRFG